MDLRRNISPIGLLRAAACVVGLAASAVSAITPTQVAVPSDRQATRVAIVPITGVIDDLTVQSVERRLQAVRAQGFDAVVIELDTPGGEITAMLDVILRIKSDAPANTVAWIHPKAFSAGTLIALSCREIVVSQGSVFGDAAPIAVSEFTGIESLSETERAKLESPLLEVLAEAAQRRGDDPRLLDAFVRTGAPLWIIERTSDGARRLADRNELARFGLDPSTPPRNPSATPSASTKPMRLTDADFAQTGAWQVVEPVVASDALLVIRDSEALQYGLATAIVDDDAQLRAYFGAQESARFSESWMEPVVRFLMSWPIRILLVAAFLVFVAIEFLHPGFGVFGVLSASCLILLVGAPVLIGIAAWWHVLLVGAGVLLILGEIFIAPGIGFAAIAGSGMLIVGLVLTFASTDPETAPTRTALTNALAILVAGGVVGVLVFWFLSRTFRESPLFRRAMLAAAIGDPSTGPPSAASPPPMVGARGHALTDLRPAGRAAFNGAPVDVQSTGGYIERGAAIVVLGMSTGTIIVGIAPPTSGEGT